jgi:pimeloyl-ACP methyl ester carboxylesterase
MTEFVKSKDGTAIAYEQSGQGQPILLVDGALCSRKFGPSPILAPILAKHFTVFTYDRRSRGESADTLPYAVEREIEDLGVLLQKAGESACVFGVSSGAALAFLAAAKGLPIRKLALYEAPFVVDKNGPDFEKLWPQIDEAMLAGKPSAAVKAFLKAVGVPSFVVAVMSLFPLWHKMKVVAHTLRYDGAIVKPYQKNRPLPASEWANIKTPTLVMDGGKSPAWMRNGMKSLSEILPNAKYLTLEGQTHDAAKAGPALEPVLKEFFRL